MKSKNVTTHSPLSFTSRGTASGSRDRATSLDPAHSEKLLAHAFLLHDSDSLSALNQLGLIYAQQNDLPRAIDFFQRALNLAPDNPSLHNNIAAAYRKLHQMDKAIHHYHQAIALEPDYAEAHNNLAALFAIQNNYQGALKHYRDAVHAAPDFTQAHYNLGMLLLQHQQLPAALIQFQNVLALNPGHVNALFYQGVLKLEDNKLAEAKQSFKTVLDSEPEHLFALNNLGVIALKNKQGQLAVDYFTKVLTFDNAHEEARSNLAATFLNHDRFENALIHYQILLKMKPENTGYLYNSGIAYMTLGHLNEAIHHFEHVLKLNPKHAAALNNLAAIAIRLNQKDRAITLLHQALATDPSDTTSRHMLNALEGTVKNPSTSTDYAANLFNNYAFHYDKHLKEQLDYQIPQHLSQVCSGFSIASVNKTLDLGCGTGLCGNVLRPLSNHLIGVDIAAKMIAQAKNKGIYDELIESEISLFLKQTNAHYDLIVAADTLPYFGELDSLFTAVNQHLNPDGYFICTTEISETMSWQLQASARFSHHLNYLEQLCKKNKWVLRLCKQVTARLQKKQPLFVYLFFLKSCYK